MEKRYVQAFIPDARVLKSEAARRGWTMPMIINLAVRLAFEPKDVQGSAHAVLTGQVDNQG